MACLGRSGKDGHKVWYEHDWNISFILEVVYYCVKGLCIRTPDTRKSHCLIFFRSVELPGEFLHIFNTDSRIPGIEDTKISM